MSAVWVRVLVMGLMACALFGSGWRFRGLKADADEARLTAEYRRLEAQAADAVARAQESLAAAGDRSAAALVVKERSVREVSRAVQKGVKDAEKMAVRAGVGACNLSVEWVRLYDAANGRPAGPAVAARDAADSAANAGLSASGYSEWDAIAVHAENAARWASCRNQLDALIDYEQAASAALGRDATITESE